MIVFFDIGFTLLGGPSQGPAARLLSQLGLPTNAKTWLNHLLFATPLHHPEELADHVRRSYGLPVSQTISLIEELWDNQAGESFALPGAREALEQLQQAQIPFAFISNIWAPFLRGFMHNFPLDFEEYPIFASFQQGCLKPDPELYRIALQRTGYSPAQAVMIGDTYETDIAPALNLGMKTVWLLHRPDKERADLVRVMNRSQPAPQWAWATLEQFTLDDLLTLLHPSIG
ncbi:MAG: HAD family hydrolase [Magnetococcales bacterium]|nr:HAD family hydrolase [Magnetococcales bacterium]